MKKCLLNIFVILVVFFTVIHAEIPMELSRIHGDLCENQNGQMRTEYNRDNEKVIINTLHVSL